MLDPEQHMVIMVPQSHWTGQAKEALDALKAAGFDGARPIIEAADVDYQQFCRLVEALNALGLAAPDLIARARLVPVDQALL